MLAAVASGWFASLDEAAKTMRGEVRTFAPNMEDAVRRARLDAWQAALAKV